MKAIAIRGGTGPAQALQLQEISRPMAADGEILIRVRAAGVNRPDIFQREGKYPPPPGAASTLGLEVSGEVVEAFGRWKEGDRVCALLPSGGYAEYAVCDARHALPIPSGLTFKQAAVLPEAIFTCYANIIEAGQLKHGETFVIHAAASGIGVTAVQMANAFGAKVVATARGDSKRERLLDLGAHSYVDMTSGSFASEMASIGGADVVLDMIGGPGLRENVMALKFGGRIVLIAALAGDAADFSVFELMRRQGIITGSTMKARSADEKARLAAEIECQVWPMLEEGKIQPIIDAVFPAEKAAFAHKHLEKGGHFGKVALQL